MYLLYVAGLIVLTSCYEVSLDGYLKRRKLNEKITYCILNYSNQISLGISQTVTVFNLKTRLLTKLKILFEAEHKRKLKLKGKQETVRS